MRLPVLASFLALLASPCFAEFSAKDCTDLAPATNQTAISVDTLRRSAERLPIEVIVSSGGPGVSAAARKVQAARDAMVPAMKQFTEAMQDLNYQLNVCGRR